MKILKRESHMEFDDLIRVRVPKSLKDELGKIARDNHQRPSDLVRQALVQRVRIEQAKQPPTGGNGQMESAGVDRRAYVTTSVSLESDLLDFARAEALKSRQSVSAFLCCLLEKEKQSKELATNGNGHAERVDVDIQSVPIKEVEG